MCCTKQNFLILAIEIIIASVHTYLQLDNPYSVQPPFKFGTVPYTNSEMVFSSHLPKMYAYMNQYNKSHPTKGILATKKGWGIILIYHRGLVWKQASTLFFNYTFISVYKIYFFIPYQRYCFGSSVCATEFHCQLWF